jgi:hypothetical protein
MVYWKDTRRPVAAMQSGCNPTTSDFSTCRQADTGTNEGVAAFMNARRIPLHKGFVTFDVLATAERKVVLNDR